MEGHKGAKVKASEDQTYSEAFESWRNEEARNEERLEQNLKIAQELNCPSSKKLVHQLLRVLKIL